MVDASFWLGGFDLPSAVGQKLPEEIFPMTGHFSPSPHRLLHVPLKILLGLPNEPYSHIGLLDTRTSSSGAGGNGLVASC